MRYSTAVQPVVDQGVACPRGHGTKRGAVNGDRSNCGFELFGFEVFFYKFLGRHRQGTDEVKHIVAACKAKFKTQFQQTIPFTQAKVLRQSRHDCGISNLKDTRGFIHKAEEFRPTRCILFRETFDRLGGFGRVGINDQMFGI
jgi:hypothetical protein